MACGGVNLREVAPERWRAQVGTLHRELAAQVDTFQRGRPSVGTKGTVDEVILALGSSGALTAVVDPSPTGLSRMIQPWITDCA